MKLGELSWDLVFNADTMKLKDFGRALGDLNMTSIFTAVGLGGVYEATKNIIEGVSATGDGLNQFSRETGQSTEELQRWSRMAKEVGVDSKTIAGTISQLQATFSNFKLFGEGISPLAAAGWRQLGIDPRNPGDYFKMLEKAYNYFSRFKDIGERNVIISKMGLPPAFEDIFSLPRDKFEAGLKSAKTFNPDDLKKAAEYQAAAADLSTDWNQTLGDIGISIIPIVTALKQSVDVLDQAVIKSAKWLYLMASIGEGIKEIGTGSLWSDYKKLAFNVFGPSGALDTVLRDPYNRMSPEYALGPASLKYPEAQVMNLNIKNMINTSDPNTSVNTSVDQSNGSGTVNSKTIRQAIGQQPQGTT